MGRVIQIYKTSRCVDVNENLSEMINSRVDGAIKNELCNELSGEAIKVANELLSKGKVIALPTDTIYGLACLADSDHSLSRLLAIKQRDLNKKFTVICVNNVNEIYKWSKVTVDREVLDDLLPGQITVVFERTELLNKNLNPSNKLIGIRIPNHSFVHSLTCSNSPLALTSANLSCEPSAGSINEFKKLWPQIDAIFDAGSLNGSDPFRLGSTVVDLSVSNKFRIIRKGCAIDRVLNVLQNRYNFEEFT